MITIERFTEIFEETVTDISVDDNCFEGLKLLSKYENYLVHGADHDIIYGPDIDVLIDANITENDVKRLRELNWMIRDEYLACFV